jgi:coproporphyrinogen III oxidase-like Fe-S oxidoreductase
MLRCLLMEWQTLKDMNQISEVRTIFFGGGTPSLMPLRLVERLVVEVSAGCSPLEVTLEGNPGDVLGKARGLHLAGVTRLSLGVQALADSDLALLNRDHTVRQALAALEEAMAVFPASTSADLIFGRPGQRPAGWLQELGRLAGLGLPHLALYQLTVERGTRLWHQVEAGELAVPGEEDMAEMYLRGVELLEGRGLLRCQLCLRPSCSCSGTR